MMRLLLRIREMLKLQFPGLGIFSQRPWLNKDAQPHLTTPATRRRARVVICLPCLAFQKAR